MQANLLSTIRDCDVVALLVKGILWGEYL